MIRGRAEGKIFPHAVSELLYGNPAPLYRIKCVPALNREASFNQVFDRHWSDGPGINNFRHYKRAINRV